MNLNGEHSKAITGRTTLSLSFDGNWWFFGCKVEYNGTSKYWTDLQTQKMVEETALQWGIPLPEAVKGASVKIIF